MNAEALIGTVLGTCTLQKLVGQGGMGAVYLAQQSRPRRQVAVKVLLPMTPLTPKQLAAFLERFRRETDAAASLEHPNIMPVHEYGEREGLAYLVMPYVSGGTLRDELERSGTLPLEDAANYLEQIAAAIDCAHEHGVIHRDIKPANILVTPEGRLLLADFGLVKIVVDGQTPQTRLTGAGAPVGTPDYMSPEQVIGEEVDARADLYSLGIILYQMVTGTTPFHGETPMQIAAQHLQIPPPSAQMMRSDLPFAADQVIQRAMAKRPSDRYARAQDLATAFRNALLTAGIQLGASYYTGGSSGGSTTGRFAIPKGQFDPMRQTSSMPKVLPKVLPNVQKPSAPLAPNTGIFGAPSVEAPAASLEPQRTPGGLLSRTGKFPTSAPPGATGAFSSLRPAASPDTQGTGLLSRTGKFPMVGTGMLPAVQPGSSSIKDGGGLLSRTGQFTVLNAPAGNAFTGLDIPPDMPPVQTPKRVPMGALPTTENIPASSVEQFIEEDEYGAMRLTGPMKVVKVPVANQPGKYVTGLMPVASLPANSTYIGPEQNVKHSRGMKFALIITSVLFLLAALGGFLWFTHGHLVPQSQSPATTPKGTTKSTPTGKSTVVHTPTPVTTQSKTLFSDPLDRNMYNWSTNPASMFAFTNGAYHIIAQDNNFGSATVLQDHSFGDHITYSLTMDEIKGDDTSATNSFGVIFRFTQQDKLNSKNERIATFYTFEVVNVNGGEYQFWKYDNSNAANPWQEINNGHVKFGNEYHMGHGPQASNRISIAMNGDQFIVTVNDTKLNQTFQDGSLKSGTVGMVVNLQGTEVAFKDLLVTSN